jgi:uncharacterized glyoxalase superfamily protein PhnB
MALGAREALRMVDPDGVRIAHCHFVTDAIAGGVQFYLGDDYNLETMNLAARAIGTKEKSPAGCYIIVPDCDVACRRFVGAGGFFTREPEDMFYGYRVGKCLDPFGVGFTFAQVLNAPSQPLSTENIRDAI